MKDRLRAVLVILAATTPAARAAGGTIPSADGSKRITLNGMPPTTTLRTRKQVTYSGREPAMHGTWLVHPAKC